VDALQLSESILVARPPADVYDLVAGLDRMGEWSPECSSCEWLTEGGPAVGGRFRGTNRRDGREWSVECEVVAADRGQEFAWVTSGGTRWAYTFEAEGDGTRVTETWTMPGTSQEMFLERFGEKGASMIEERRTNALDGSASGRR
jgi:hypothetical protein